MTGLGESRKGLHGMGAVLTLRIAQVFSMHVLQVFFSSPVVEFEDFDMP
jgi:hypothetical protein